MAKAFHSSQVKMPSRLAPHVAARFLAGHPAPAARWMRERGRFDRHQQTDAQANHEDGFFAPQSSLPAKSLDRRRGSFARPDIANPGRFIAASISTISITLAPTLAAPALCRAYAIVNRHPSNSYPPVGDIWSKARAAARGHDRDNRYESCLRKGRGLTRHPRTMIRLLAIGIGAATSLSVLAVPALAENPDIWSRRAEQRRTFSDAEIRDGFFKIALDAELQIGARTHRIRKFDEPVRIFVDGKVPRERVVALDAVIADIRQRIDHLDIAATTDRKAANFVVTLVSARDLLPTMRARFGNEGARQIEHSLNPQCLSGIAKDGAYRIRRAEVILLPVDAGDFAFYDCAYEELLQGLGAINDGASVPWTMFNDDVQMGFFDIYDQLLLNILYDPRVRY
ncbi:DUF2927 domain-containing protein [Bradyrhizobium denitrificans]|uniref:DUF2927 domain-containing protein n=1 Tax=Bradyrhizobium denitrificans TaxID=2734912 RepID=A0ABS5G576_9BRAD|nr:DUF2927 domain-containing protein [Bradyrhizobium denitrificans]